MLRICQKEKRRNIKSREGYITNKYKNLTKRKGRPRNLGDILTNFWVSQYIIKCRKGGKEMNLINALKKKYEDEIRKKDIEARQRRQLNMVVDGRLIDVIKTQAAQFTVPRYCLVEHLLEIGCFNLIRAIKHEDKAKMLRHHLINVHLIDNGIDDSEAILRIGEGSNISQLLSQVRPVLRSWEAYKHALAIAKKTRDITHFEKSERALMQSVVGFALWIEEHRLDELDHGNIAASQSEADLSG